MTASSETDTFSSHNPLAGSTPWFFTTYENASGCVDAPDGGVDRRHAKVQAAA